MDGISNHITAKKYYGLQDVAYTVSIFSGVDPQKRPDACTQTPISAGLASVPIVTVLRKDHRCASLTGWNGPA